MRRFNETSPKPGNLLEHKRQLWDSISLRSDSAILLTGVGIYVPHGGSGGVGGETLICVDARPLVDPLRPLDVASVLDSEYGNEEETELSIFSRVSA